MLLAGLICRLLAAHNFAGAPAVVLPNANSFFFKAAVIHVYIPEVVCVGGWVCVGVGVWVCVCGWVGVKEISQTAQNMYTFL